MVLYIEILEIKEKSIKYSTSELLGALHILNVTLLLDHEHI